MASVFWGARKLGSIRRMAAASPRARILFWATVAAVACGAVDAAQPIDRFLHTVRDSIRARPADGSIVVVEVNGRTQREVDALGAQRATDAAALEGLFRLGANRVFFDKVYTDPSPIGDDAVLARVMQRHPGRVVLATRFEHNRRTGEFEPLFPVPILRQSVELGSINIWRDSLGYTSRVPFRSEIGGQSFASFSSLLARRPVNSFETFTPDYSIRFNTVPTVNLLDVLRNSPVARVVKGRDVVIAKTADSLGDTHNVPGQGPIPGVYVHVIGAETLKTGIPIDIGWWPTCLLALLASFAYLRCDRKDARLAIAGGSFTSLLVGGLVLDVWHVEAPLVPAILLLGIVVLRARILDRRARNPLTGLPTLDSILRDGSTSALTLVGVKIGNYADLRATLNDMEERELTGEVVRRLRVGGEPIDLMHAGDSFVWKTPMPVGTPLFDHVEGLHALLTSPVVVGGRMVDLTVGFGVEDGCDRPLTNRVGSLQVSASEAVAAGAKYRLHDPQRLQDAGFRQSLLSRLDLALDNGEIWVAYQPKLDLKAKRLTGAEALVRWSHPDRGLISPDQFIPVAEQANRIAGLTYFVLETAIRDARRMDAVDPGFTVAVNLSVRMLGHPDLPDQVKALLAKHGLDPGRLTLEITENEEIDPAGRDLRTLHALRALGVHLSIDDYGTKFSTLDYVRQLPASEIKIDQRFIATVHQDRSAWIMARSTVELAHSLGLTVVAEGVELPETMAALVEMNCDVAQGFLIGRPIRFAELKQFVSATRLRRVA
jgi:EAL domain-containing protein (putative c-di-GMP-specific phosphodiesterase class I)/CHASE2 domain-containing sensor protein